MIKVCPSLLAADFGHLSNELQMLNNSKADFIHLDIMDGIFVPNISFGFSVTKYVALVSKKPLDFHLMIQNPDLYINQCVDHNASLISVHLEACNHLHRTLCKIKELGCKAGVALNPHTSVELLQDVMDILDFVVVMSVNPGFGGQFFIENTYAKVRKLSQMKEISGDKFEIEIDGGVGLDNASQLGQSGATMLVAGSSVFMSNDPKASIKQLKYI